eukprot:CAMPEP_0169286974 /NCGR_PEP_ID=MMETSP1016-20121227/59618_1 /TAXON_ID=342587 /ORGANISM="Karlodinium micrum, Strain CCMP2283" /LENGTH=73 /DNA_ID=CAMNT_0009376785 /DNA_START=170 /DNA_END=388 /DNA_ORIENTATION=-
MGLDQDKRMIPYMQLQFPLQHFLRTHQDVVSVLFCVDLTEQSINLELLDNWKVLMRLRCFSGSNPRPISDWMC